MPDEDKNFGGSLVLDFGQWWRHVKTIYKPHSTRSGGGVALYIRENLSYTNRIDLVPDTLEMICVEINLPHSRSFLVSTWYRPPSAEMQLFDEYEKFVQSCDIEHKQLILMGDINSDYAKTRLDVHTRTMQFISSVYQLEQLIKEPIRVTKSSATTIDLIFNKYGRQYSSLWCYSSRDFRSQSNLCGTKVCCTQN